MGPKTLSMLHKEKGISNLSQLEKAVENGSLIGLPGIGEKKVENIKRGIQLLKQSKGRMNLGIAFPVAKRIVETLREKTGSKKIEWAGSLRRMKENIGDIDILATGPDQEKIIHDLHPSSRSQRGLSLWRDQGLCHCGRRNTDRPPCGGRRFLWCCPPVFHRIEGPQHPSERDR